MGIKQKRTKGITLIALVITIVILIILSVISLQIAIHSDSSLFSVSMQSGKEYTKKSLLETVELAKADLAVENYKEDIDISKLIDKIEEMLSSEEKDYIITKDEDEQTATIIDPSTNVVIDIWVDENGNIHTEGSIVDDIADVIKPTIIYEINPPIGTYGEEVEITIIAKETNKGIAKIEFQGNAETCNNEKEITKKYTVTEAGTYKVTVEGANGRKATTNIEVNNIISAGSIILEAQNTNPTAENVSVKIVYDENIELGGQVLTNENRFQYSIGENNWKVATDAETTVEVGTSGVVYARYFDGEQGFKTTSLMIQNIDREKPVISSAVASTSWGTTNSVTITAIDIGTLGCAENCTGIVSYGINQSNTTEPTYTTVEATTNLSTTISNITENGTYYVWVKDQAGNTANAEVIINRIDKINPTTATIVSSSVTKTTFTLTATGADGESGIAKYEFYINNSLEHTENTTAGTATYNVTGKASGTTYTCKVIVYDNAGNHIESNTITVTTTSSSSSSGGGSSSDDDDDGFFIPSEIAPGADEGGC